MAISIQTCSFMSILQLYILDDGMRNLEELLFCFYRGPGKPSDSNSYSLCEDKVQARVLHSPAQLSHSSSPSLICGFSLCFSLDLLQFRGEQFKKNIFYFE